MKNDERPFLPHILPVELNMLKDLRRKTKKARVKPDEVFQGGGVTMARFGRFVISKNNMTPTQYDAFRTKMVQEFPKYCKKIDEIVLDIRDQVQKFDPLILLKYGYFNLFKLIIGKKSESEYGAEETYALRMLDYIQSVIVATPGPYDKPDNFDEKLWENLHQTVEKLYSNISPWFQIARSAFLEANNKSYDVKYDMLYVQAEMLWLHVRGDRYSVHNTQHLYDLLIPHDEIIKELFGISAGQLVDAMDKIQFSLSFGLGQILGEMHDFQNKVLSDKLVGYTENAEEMIRKLAQEVAEKEEYREQRDSIAGRFFGLDLFDVGKTTNLPEALLKLLSWRVGEEKEFFAPGEYSGWPLRLLPVKVRPFLCIEDKFYCFDLSNLMDNIYRAIQRIITRLKPEYKEKWNEIQKYASESIPFGLLRRILPEATVYKNVYYRGLIGSGNKTDWCEVDGLVIYDDHLIVIEVKAGAFTYTPPTSDFTAYINSVKDLILKPADQASRFVQLLNTKKEVVIFDKRHNRIDTIKKNTFRQITPCCVTIDNLTELAAQADKLGGIGVTVPLGVWCTSINDLRVYADLFDSPIIFMHFLEQRLKAASDKTVALWDELDHLGLYFKHNLYVQYINGVTKDFGANFINWQGYRKKIDEYYHMKMIEPEKSEQVRQDGMKGYFAKTIELIGRSRKPGFCKAASYLLDMSGQARINFNSMITIALSKYEENGKITPISLFGEICLTVFCYSKGTAQPTKRWTYEHALKRMLIAGKKTWLSLILTFDENHIITGVDFENLRENDIPADQRARLEMEAKIIQRQKVKKRVLDKGRIGRNELCPCGSGKKYKRCCGAES